MNSNLFARSVVAVGILASALIVANCNKETPEPAPAPVVAPAPEPLPAPPAPVVAKAPVMNDANDTLTSKARTLLSPGTDVDLAVRGFRTPQQFMSVAYAANMIVAGSDDVSTDRTLAHVRGLGNEIRLTWGKRTRKGFFLRAEDYFGFVRRLATLRASLQKDLDETEAEFKDKGDYARSLATGPQRGQLRATVERYGGDLDAKSHGESFLTFFNARFVPGGLHRHRIFPDRNADTQLRAQFHTDGVHRVVQSGIFTRMTGCRHPVGR